MNNIFKKWYPVLPHIPLCIGCLLNVVFSNFQSDVLVVPIKLCPVINDRIHVC